MLIVCPACASDYVIDAARIGAEGRSVRCAACRETWLITPDDVAAGLAAEMAEMTEALAAAQGPNASGQTRDEAQAALDAWEAAMAEDAKAADSPGPEPESPAPGAARRANGASKPPAGEGSGKSLPGFLGLSGFLGLPGPAAVALGGLAMVALALVGRATVVRAMPQSAALYAGIGLPVNLRGLELSDVVAFQTKADDGQGQLVVEGDVVGAASGLTPAPPIAIAVRDALGQPLYRWTIPSPRPSLDKRETARFRASLSAPPALGRSVEVTFAEAEAPPETMGKGTMGKGTMGEESAAKDGMTPSMAKPDAGHRQP